jgi:hypothetical protein
MNTSSRGPIPKSSMRGGCFSQALGWFLFCGLSVFHPLQPVFERFYPLAQLTGYSADPANPKKQDDDREDDQQFRNSEVLKHFFSSFSRF